MDATSEHSDSTSETCPFCKNLDQETFPNQPNGKWQYASLTVRWSSIQANSMRCLSCAMLVNILRRFCKKSYLESQPIHVTHHHTIRLKVGQLEEILLYCLEVTPWSSIQIQNHITGWTDSEDSLNFVKETLSACSQEHELCRTPEDTPLPTRVLDLGTKTNLESGDTIRLYETDHQRAPYACLSHRWGSTHRIMTTTDSIQSHKEGINVASLPRTFKDAIDFTRRLGIRYLWIDSLCIIQDDVNDWKREATQMSEIYRNCILCLAATNSGSDDGGCYSGDPIRTECIKSSSFASSGENTTPWEVYAREVLHHRALTDPVFPSGNDGYSPGVLRTRGWVYQERILAPRYLHFLERELAWECRSGASCECHCQCDLMTMGRKKSEVASVLASSDGSKLAFEWRQMIVMYSNLKLTFENDRLPAIAGIAKLFQEARSSTCHAGIWNDSAEEDLSWQVWDPGAWRDKMERTYTRTEGIPSWSWASVSAPVMYDPLPFDQNERLCDIIEVGYPSLIIDSDEYGRNSYKLTISGYMLPGTLHYKDDGRHCNLEVPGYGKPRHFGNDVLLGTPGPSFIPSGEILYCLSLVKSPFQYKSLVLRELDKTKHLYQRIGILRHSDNIFTDVSHKTLVDII